MRLTIMILLLGVAQGCQSSRSNVGSRSDKVETLLKGSLNWSQVIMPKTFLDPDPHYLGLQETASQLNASRLEAAELQNLWRDRLQAGLSFEDAQLLALEDIRSGRWESKINPSKLRAASAIVVVELQALIVQQEPPLFNTSANRWIRQLQQLGVAVVVWTSLEDALAWKIVRQWKIDSLPAEQVLDGVLTANYMTKKLPGGQAEKDLRILDPLLQSVVAVETNPDQVLQSRSVRWVPHGNADSGANLETVIKELEESLRWNRGSLAQAFGPYTVSGRQLTQWKLEQGMSLPQAREWVRQNATSSSP